MKIDVSRLISRTPSLPVLGIVAFSGCSTNALARWLMAGSLSKTPWYWVAACLVEGCTAWIVWQIVDTVRMLSKSRLSKGDARFYRIALGVFAMMTIPSLGASIAANYVEFQGDPLRAVLFPVLSLACAVGAALPSVVSRYNAGKAEERALAKKAKAERGLAKGKQAVAKAVPEALSYLQRREAIFAELCTGNGKGTSDFANLFGVSLQSIRNDYRALAKAGKVSYEGGVVTVPEATKAL